MGFINKHFIKMESNLYTSKRLNIKSFKKTSETLINILHCIFKKNNDDSDGKDKNNYKITSKIAEGIEIFKTEKNQLESNSNQRVCVEKKNYIEKITILDHDVVLQVSIHQIDFFSLLLGKILILGSQLISELIDHISNVINSNFIVGSSKSLPFLIIDNYFFYDTKKTKKNVNLKKVFNWLTFLNKNYHSSNINNFKFLPMEKFCFNDLTITIGHEARGILCDCNNYLHILWISDVRMWHANDNLFLKNQYPIFYTKFKKPIIKCLVCLTNQATRLIYYDRNSNREKMIYCDGCYYNLHFDESAMLIYSDFIVLPL